jgi:hypothetical protein
LFKIIKPPINLWVEANANVAQLDGASDWQVVFTFQMLFPK